MTIPIVFFRNYFLRICAYYRPQRLLGRRAGIAVITAMSAPLLIAATILSVNVGYWYEQQASLQSAADAAALAAANAALTYDTSTSDIISFTDTTGQAFALAAANTATDGQFNFALSGTNQVTVSAGTSNSEVTFTAIASVPSTNFFSRLIAHSQSTSATAAYAITSFSPCGYISNTITVNGGSMVDATDCGIYAGAEADTSAASIITTGSSQVIGVGGVETPANTVSASGNSYIGTNANGGSGNSTSTATTDSSSVDDPLAGLNSNNTELWDPGITVPSVPSSATHAYNISSQLNSPWNTQKTGGTYCDTTYGTYTIPAGSCLTDADVLGSSGYLTGVTGWGLGSSGSSTYDGYTLLANTVAGETIIENGLTGQINGGNFSLDDTTYYISGGFQVSLPADGSLYFGTGSSAINATVIGTGTSQASGLTVGNAGGGTAIFSSGSYIIAQAPPGDAPDYYALTINVPSLTLEAGTYEIYGGAQTQGSTTSTYMQSGLYEFEGAASLYDTPTCSFSQYYSSCSTANGGSSGAFLAQEGSVTFGTTSSDGTCGSTPSTWFFNGGLTLTNGTTKVQFCPGIYYIKNGYLVFASGTNINGTGVTFVLEGDSGFIFDGAATISLSAPTSNCVNALAYPEAAYNAIKPYDGTNGEGICGIAIYQLRDDQAPDFIDEGASTTVAGSVYVPKASLYISGAGTLNITSSDIPALVADSLTDNGSGNVALTETNLAGTDSGSSSVALLVH